MLSGSFVKDGLVGLLAFIVYCECPGCGEILWVSFYHFYI
jgi:hypothetical protein